MATFPIKPILEFLIDPEFGANRVKRFWSQVDRGAENDCWDWMRCRSGKGLYGMYGIAGKPRRANRVAWAIANQAEPGNLLIRHTCDRPICCNPAHLVTGTHQDNMNDKGRRGSPVRKPRQTKGGHTLASLHQENDRLRAALLHCHDVMHECTAVLTASDCAKVAAAMAEARTALTGKPAA